MLNVLFEISCRVWIKQLHLNHLFCKLTQYVTLSYTLYLSHYATIAHTLMLKITKCGGAEYQLRKNTVMDFVIVIYCLASHRFFPRSRINETEICAFSWTKWRHDFSTDKISERVFTCACGSRALTSDKYKSRDLWGLAGSGTRYVSSVIATSGVGSKMHLDDRQIQK